jgi:hypothetical protein
MLDLAETPRLVVRRSLAKKGNVLPRLETNGRPGSRRAGEGSVGLSGVGYEESKRMSKERGEKRTKKHLK